jgi:hypothetical protein
MSSDVSNRMLSLIRRTVLPSDSTRIEFPVYCRTVARARSMSRFTAFGKSSTSSRKPSSIRSHARANRSRPEAGILRLPLPVSARMTHEYFAFIQ